MAISHGYKRPRTARPGSLFAVEAQRLVAIGRAAEAIELCKRGLVYYPDHITGYIILSQAYLGVDQKERALNVLYDGYRRTSSPQLEELRAQLLEKREAPDDLFAHEQTAGNGAGKAGFEHFLPQIDASHMKGLRIELEDGIPEAEPSVESVVAEDAVRENFTQEALLAAVTENASAFERISNDSLEERQESGEEVQNDAARNEDEATVLEESNQSETDSTIPIFIELQRVEPVPAITPELKYSDQADRIEIPEKPLSIEPASTDRGRYLSLAIHAGKNIARLRSSNLRLIPGLEFAPLRSGDHSHRQPIAPLINEPLPQLKFPERLSKGGGSESVTAITTQESGKDVSTFQTFTSEEQSRATQARRDIPGVDHTSIESITPPLDAPERVYQEQIDNPARRKRRAYGTAGVSSVVDEEIPFTFNPLLIPESSGEELTPLEELARRLEHARIPVVEEDEPQATYEPSIVSETLANILVAQGKYIEALKAFQTLARTKPERYEHFQQKIIEIKWRLQNPETTEVSDKSKGDA